MNLIDHKAPNCDLIWNEFHERYFPVSQRGREWTELNFDRLKERSVDFKKWWKFAKSYKSLLQFVTLEEYYDKINSDDDLEIMKILFDYAWFTILNPLFESHKKWIYIGIDEKSRKELAFTRYMVSNLFLLIKHDVNIEEVFGSYLDFLIKCEDIPTIKEKYLNKVKELYEKGHIDVNEYHNCKNIYIMIPPNILKKDVYAK